MGPVASAFNKSKVHSRFDYFLRPVSKFPIHDVKTGFRISSERSRRREALLPPML